MDSKHPSGLNVAAAAGLCNPDVPVAFARALQARVDYAMAICTTDERSAERDELLTRARYGARDLGRDLVLVGAADLGCSPLLADVPMLRDAFEREVNLTQLEQADEKALLAEVMTGQEGTESVSASERAAAERRAATKAAIAAGDWTALDLPTPEAFVQALAAGKSVDVNGHSFDFVGDEGLWCTNPYGVDAYFGDAIPSITYARELLSAIALGTVFGDSPPDSN
ncbi:hypothetical protein [Burkholderia contaminans]|uniref:Uncharacterized protein n=1 Tax=Burkholderia contaminans TaxID=488447 RepID=A0A3N8QS54_9BURK|nr:hypothetical protein [Burkholderia contaminans]RQT22106.1 hypothetical protein DF037_28785 [Burkholderia contaminans]